MEHVGELFTVLYSDLHRMARRRLASRGRDLTMSATALLHEAYLDVASRDRVFPDRGRFLAYVSRVMRARMVDHFRRVHSRKRGSGVVPGALPDEVAAPPAAGERVRVRQALEGLAAAEPLLADVLDLHVFGGFTHREIAAMRGLSERTVQRLWHRVRTQLREAICAAA
jgi:RNA polymerase sigma factor (TIGR02999 family)